MAESYYGDDDAPDSAPAAAPEDKPKADENKTALIDSDICPGMKPGEEMVVKIEKVLDKEYLVSYAPEPDKESEESEPAETDQGQSYGGGEAETAPSMAGLME